MRFPLFCMLIVMLAAGACNSSNQPGGGTNLGRGSDKADGVMGGGNSPGGTKADLERSIARDRSAAEDDSSASQSTRANPGGSGSGTGGNPGGTTGGTAPGGD